MTCYIRTEHTNRLCDAIFGEDNRNDGTLAYTSALMTSYSRKFNVDREDITESDFTEYWDKQLNRKKDEIFGMFDDHAKVQKSSVDKSSYTVDQKTGAVTINVSNKHNYDAAKILEIIQESPLEKLQSIYSIEDAKLAISWFYGLKQLLESDRGRLSNEPMLSDSSILEMIENKLKFKHNLNSPEDADLLEDNPIYSDERLVRGINYIMSSYSIDNSNLALFQFLQRKQLQALIENNACLQAAYKEGKLDANLAMHILNSYIYAANQINKENHNLLDFENADAIFNNKRSALVEENIKVEDGVVRGENIFDRKSVIAGKLFSLLDKIDKTKTIEAAAEELAKALKKDRTLMLEIEKAGGLEYLTRCKYNTPENKKSPNNTTNDDLWEKQNGLIKALSAAYQSVTTTFAEENPDKINGEDPIVLKTGFTANAKQDRAKASVSNLFIGFGEKGTQTRNYQDQYAKEKRANISSTPRKYNAGDVVFVYVNESPTIKQGESQESFAKRQQQFSENQEKTRQEVESALAAGAIIVTSTKSYVQSKKSNYNAVEQQMHDYLTSKGYIYSEILGKEGIRVGRWRARAFDDDLSLQELPTARDLNLDNPYTEYNIPRGEVVISGTSALYDMARDFTDAQLTARINNIADVFSEQLEKAVKERYDLLKNTAEPLLTQKDLDFIDHYEDGSEEDRLECYKRVIEDTVKKTREYYLNKWRNAYAGSEEDVFKRYRSSKMYVCNQYALIDKHFDELLKQASTKIQIKTGISLKNNNSNFFIEATDDTKSEQKDNVEEADEQKSEGNEGWSFDSATADHFKKSKVATKRVLAGIKEISFMYKGTTPVYKRDDLCNIEYVSAEKAYSILVNELSKKILTAEDFNIKHVDDKGSMTWEYPALEQLVKKYPWMVSVLEECKKDNSVATALYHDCVLQFDEYWSQYEDDGTRKIQQMNKPITIESSLLTINANIKSHTLTNELCLWDEKGVINETNKNKLALKISSVQSVIKQSPKTYKLTDKDAETMAFVVNAVGMPITKEEIMSLSNEKDAIKKLDFILDRLNLIINGAKDEDGNAFLDAKKYYTELVEALGTVIDTQNKRTFHQDGKTYQSYVQRNYLGELTRNILSDRYEEYIEEEFMYDSFFYDKENKEFLCQTLSDIMKDANFRKNFNTIYIKTADGLAYQDWSEVETQKVFLTQYFNSGDKDFAYFHTAVPAEVATALFMTIKKAARTVNGVYDTKTAIKKLSSIVQQELVRIDTIKKRKACGVKDIQSYDSRGDKFLFFPKLNTLTIDGKTLIQAINEDKTQENINKQIEKYLSAVMKEECKIFIKKTEDRCAKVDAQKRIKEGDTKSIDELKKSINALSENDYIMKMTEYFYNNAFAQAQIIQLTTTDLAYYKNYTTYQKRNKQIYASGARLNTESRHGRKTERSIYLKDVFKTSLSYTSLQENMQQFVDKGFVSQQSMDFILSAMRNINATDGQAYRHANSYKAILDMLGDWTPKLEAAFNRIQNGDYQAKDFYIVLSSIKSYLYGNVSTYNGVSGYNRVPHQDKYSEALLMASMLGNIMHNSVSKSPQLLGLNRIMEDYDIDNAIFESGSKVGNQFAVDISYSRIELNKIKYGKHGNKNSPITKLWENVEQYALAELGEKDYSKASDGEKFKAYLDRRLKNKEISQKEYNGRIKSIAPKEQEVYDIIESAIKPSDKAIEAAGVVREINERLLTGTNSNGTKLTKDEKDEYVKAKEDKIAEFKKANTNEDERVLTCDIKDGVNFNVLVLKPYKYYMIAQETPNHIVDALSVFGSQFRNLLIADLPEDFTMEFNGKTYDKQETIDLYNEIIVENILEDYDSVVSLFKDNKKLQKKIINMCQGNPSYGPDVMNALSIVVRNGKEVFNIPTNSTTINGKLEQLLLAVVKNKVTKQYLKGAAAVLVSSYGFDSELRVLRDKNNIPDAFEVMLPATTKDLFEDFLKPISDPVTKKIIGQEINIKRVQKEAPELLEGISFRIPTESKYSMARLIVKGFLPQQLGATMILPAETTVLAGEDYDIDKKFILLKKHIAKKVWNMNSAFNEWLETEETAEYKALLQAAGQENYEKYFKALPEQELDELNSYEDEEEKKKAIQKIVNDFYKKEEVFSKYDSKKWITDEDKKKEILTAFYNWFYSQDEERKAKYAVLIRGKQKTRIIVPKYDTSKDASENSRIQRDNAIVDIAMAIWSSPKTFHLRNRAGNFDTLKLEAVRNALLKDAEAIEAYKKDKEKALGTKLTFSEALNMIYIDNIDNLSNYVDNNEDINPLSDDTFIYYQQQNVIGGKLVGALANNSSAQAKFQESNLEITDAYSFTLNGQKLQSLHDYRREIEESELQEDGSIKTSIFYKILSENCAEFSASAVDNVKDPILAKLGVTIDNVFICGAMTRMGLTIKEIGLFYSLPFFSTRTSDILDTAEAKTLYETNNAELSVTSMELMLVITGKADESMKNKVKAILARIVTVADSLRTLTSVTRADSPNGAISNTVAGVIMQQIKVRSFLEKEGRKGAITGYRDILECEGMEHVYDKESMRNALLNPDTKMRRFQGFRYAGIVKPITIVKKIFKQLNDEVVDRVEYINSQFPLKTIDDQLVRTYLDEMTSYAISDIPLFNSQNPTEFLREKTKYTVEFPYLFANKRSAAKFKNFKVMKSLSVDNGDIVFIEGIRLPGIREELQRELNSMLSSSDPEISKMAIDLFKYCYHRYNLGWSVNGFNFLFDSLFLSSFPSYIRTLERVQYSLSDKEDWENFDIQFFINHASQLFHSVQNITGTESEFIEQESKFVYNMKTNSPYEFVNVNGALYVLVKYNRAKAYYQKVGENPVRNAVYNKNMDHHSLFSTYFTILNHSENKFGIKGKYSHIIDRSSYKNNRKQSYDPMDYIDNMLEGIDDMFEAQLSIEANIDNIMDPFERVSAGNMQEAKVRQNLKEKIQKSFEENKLHPCNL